MFNLVTAAFQLLIVGIISVLEFNRRSVSIFYWAMLLVIFSLPHFVSVLLGNTIYSNDTLTKASLFVIGFCIIYELGRRVHLREKHPKVKLPSIEIDESQVEYGIAEKVALVAFSLLCVGMLLFSSKVAVNAGGSSWGAIYQAQSEAGVSVATFAPYFFPALCGAIAVSIIKRRWLTLLILCATASVYLLISRNRIIALTILIPILFLVAAKHKRLTGGQAVTYILLAILIVFCVYALLVFRHAGTLEVFIQNYDLNTFISEVLSNIFSNEGELGLRNIFYYFIDNGNNFTGFNEGASYIRILFFWLPGSLSGGIKPDDFAITMASAYLGMPNNDIYSVHPTFFGDAFANFSYFGILLGLLWAAIFNILDVWLGRMASHRKIYCISAIGFCLIIIGRGSVYNGCVMAIVALLVIKFLDVLSVFKKASTG